MNRKSNLMAVIAAAALASAGALAQSPNTPTPPSPPAPDMKSSPSANSTSTMDSAAPTPKMTGEDAKADADYRAAQTACNSQPDSTRAQCLADAKAKFDRARTMSEGAGGAPTMPTSKSGSGSASSGTSGGTTAGDSGGRSGGTSGSSSGTGDTGAGTGPK